MNALLPSDFTSRAQQKHWDRVANSAIRNGSKEQNPHDRASPGRRISIFAPLNQRNLSINALAGEQKHNDEHRVNHISSKLYWHF